MLSRSREKSKTASQWRWKTFSESRGEKLFRKKREEIQSKIRNNHLRLRPNYKNKPLYQKTIHVRSSKKRRVAMIAMTVSTNLNLAMLEVTHLIASLSSRASTQPRRPMLTANKRRGNQKEINLLVNQIVWVQMSVHLTNKKTSKMNLVQWTWSLIQSSNYSKIREFQECLRSKSPTLRKRFSFL